MTTNGDVPLKVVPVRHVGRWISVCVVFVLLAMLVHTLFSRLPTTPAHFTCRMADGARLCTRVTEWRFSWNIVGQYFLSSEILHGLLLTLYLTLMAMIIGIVLGVVLAIMRLSPNRLLSSLSWTYTWFFRGTPVLVQLFVWFFFAALYHQLTLGIPFTHITFLHLNTLSLITTTSAAILAFGTNEAAYFSEIARSGLISVSEGQSEAASSLGMTRMQAMRHVILPQAMRVILPPTGNEVISMLKTTSLASGIGAVELLGAASNIYAQNYEEIPLLITACLWYLIVTTILSSGQFYLERHFAKGALRTPPPTPLQRLKSDVIGIAKRFRSHPDVARSVR